MSREDRKRKADDVGSDSGFVKAVVSEQNGEISCSVEETNRIRALLGLKPLVLNKDSEEQRAVQNFKKKQEDDKRSADEAEVRRKIEQARTKRLLNESLGGSSLGNIGHQADNDLLSASDWVQRSRQKQDLEKVKAAEAAKRLDEADAYASRSKYSSAELKGLQVMHDSAEFEVGQEVILTLADSNILDVDDNGKMIGINTKTDVLENVNFADKERRLEREQRNKRLRQPIYAGHDDHEFSSDGQPRSLLPQYDAEKKQGPRIVLGDEGMSIGNNGDSVQTKAANEDVEKIAVSLKMETKESSDFYTPMEYASFAKHKKGDKEKKKRKIRKKTNDDDEEGGGGKGGVSAMISMLEAELEEGKMDNGQSAAVSAKSEIAKVIIPVKKSFAPVEDDDADLQRAVAFSRKLALLQQGPSVDKVSPDADMGAVVARTLLEKSKTTMSDGFVDSQMDVEDRDKNDNGAGYYGALKKQSAGEEDHGLTFDEIDAEGRRADGSLVFTSTTEFTTRLQARLNEKARSRAEAAVRAAAASEQNELNKDEGEDGETLSVDQVSMTVDEEGADMDGESENGDDQMDFVHRQPLVASGMAATLALLKGSGELQKKDQLAGRAKDSREGDPSARDIGVKLEYRDENGRLLTKHEAFRQLCYRFHGITPSRKKAEKRLAAIELQNKAASSRGVMETGTMKSLLKTQEATGKAHVTVQGGLSGMTSAMDLAANLSKAKSKK